MEKRMPVLFVGHGSPMNAIEDNRFTKEWEALASKLPKPKSIIVVSAHWYTQKTGVLNVENPITIYDMYGFPDELYEIVYAAPGNKVLANKCNDSLENALLDESWGFDHGAWSVLCRMYPDANIPVIQISINGNASAQEHFEMGRKLSQLRDEDVLIIGSGNIVHNLGLIDWSNEGGFNWAVDFDQQVKDYIMKYDYKSLIDYHSIPNQTMAFKYPDHYLPLLYVLGATNGTEQIEVFNEGCVNGSLSMTSYIFR